MEKNCRENKKSISSSYKEMKNYLVKILGLFIAWRIILTIGLIVGLLFIPLNYPDKFLGGGLKNYLLFPQLFSWANFDGEHYLAIAIFGYKGLEQAFFPVYPLIISFLSKPFSEDLISSLVFGTSVGLIISNLAFLLALIYLYRLIIIDFSKKIGFWTLVLLVIFPTSFYFGALYNESLYLLVSVLTFYYARKGKWWLASLFGFLATATRIFGIILLPALLIEAVQQKIQFKKMFWLFIIPLGLLSYMIYQGLTVGDPWAFYHLQKLVGEQHQSGLTSLPQVYFRYIKMLLTVDVTAPIYQTVILEFIVGIVFFLLPIYGYFKKMRLSYVFYSLISFLIPTIQGSFSSLPRYILVFFPSFIAFSLMIEKWPTLSKILLSVIMTLLLLLETTLFLRGYWVA